MFTKDKVTTTVLDLVKARYGSDRRFTKYDTFASIKFDKYDIMFVVMGCEEIFGIDIAESEFVLMADIKSVVNKVIEKLKAAGKLQSGPQKAKAAEPVAEKAEEPTEEVSDNAETDSIPEEETATVTETPMAEKSTHELVEEAKEKLGLTDKQAEAVEEKMNQIEAAGVFDKE